MNGKLAGGKQTWENGKCFWLRGCAYTAAFWNIALKGADIASNSQRIQS
jgi:hypothetical protein